ncbi:uncharacterized protein LOC124645194 [Helicoverpa zea]|uniref:uncharacterized protein LOC124645194 n=1 Tax=Helicoverpa zea TaxID=7113 RepID=UPI001F562FCA|nr:uncharacterized protein LOC124645194 [Helicoverpa zea]
MSDNEVVNACLDEDWLADLIKEYEKEATEELNWVIVFLQPKTRQTVWEMCAILDVLGKGVPGQACYLMERYLAIHMRKFLQQSRSVEEWITYKALVNSRLNQIMLGCVILAGKMMSNNPSLAANIVHNNLLRKGVRGYTKRDIVEFEFHVFKTLDFRLPLWSTLDTSEYLLKRLGIERANVALATSLMNDLAEYYRHDIDYRTRLWSMRNTPSSSTSSSSMPYPRRLYNLHFCAGVVAAAIRFMNHPMDSPWVRLAQLVRACPAYIGAIANDIYWVAMAPNKKNKSPDQIGPASKRVCH